MKPSGNKTAAFGQSGGAVLLEDVAAIEIAILVKMNVGRRRDVDAVRRP